MYLIILYKTHYRFGIDKEALEPYSQSYGVTIYSPKDENGNMMLYVHSHVVYQSKYHDITI